jgi:hypothetical protein
MLLSWEPPMKGLLDAGHSATAATHEPAATKRAVPAPSSCSRRLRTGVGAAIRYTSANPGTTRSACSIFVRKPSPTSVPASSSHEVCARSTARESA